MKLLFAAGGTGGHVIPALAIAKAAQHLYPNVEILFVGTERGFERQLVPQAGYRLKFIEVAGIKGKGILDIAKGLWLLPVAFFQSWKVLKQFKPTAVFGIGGYTSGPILLLAALKRIKTAILEPNSKAGFSNRILGKFVGKIYVAFQESIPDFTASKCIFSGNPLRLEILSVPSPSFEGDKRTVLIFGGSQGARRLNDGMIASLKELLPYKDRLTFIHQTGTLDDLRVREAYRMMGFRADVFPFQDDMAALYKKADFVIARSGSSVLEIAACGLPAILIPYPYAADDHQRVNARILEKAGAAIYLEDVECTGSKVASLITDFLKEKSKLIVMSRCALDFRKDDAAEKIAKDLLDGLVSLK